MNRIAIFLIVFIFPVILANCSKQNGESDSRTGASIKENPVKLIEENATKVWPDAVYGKYMNSTETKREWFILKKDKKFELVKHKLVDGKITGKEPLKVNGKWVVLKKGDKRSLLLKSDNQRRYFNVIKQGGYRNFQSLENKKQVYYPVAKK